jgi:hypothetical protein
MKKLVLIFFAIVVFSLFDSAFAESYNYLPDSKLNGPPVVCATGFEDSLLPDASKILIEKTENAVLAWESKLIEYTGNEVAWNFKFFTITKEDKNFPDSAFCNIYVDFAREPTKEKDKNMYGGTYTEFGFAFIKIFYLEPIINDELQDSEYAGGPMKQYTFSGYQNKIQVDIDNTIKHELGHALGLDHPRKDQALFLRSIEDQNILSIMLPQDPTYEKHGVYRDIIDYDVRAVVNLYGENGPQYSPFLPYADYIFFGTLLVITGFILHIINKKIKKEEYSVSNAI